MTPAEGSELLFSLDMDGADLRVVDPTGRTRMVTPPWRVDNQFWRAHHFYDRLTREDGLSALDRVDLFNRATTLGSLLFEQQMPHRCPHKVQRCLQTPRLLRKTRRRVLLSPREVPRFGCVAGRAASSTPRDADR